MEIDEKKVFLQIEYFTSKHSIITFGSQYHIPTSHLKPNLSLNRVIWKYLFKPNAKSRTHHPNWKFHSSLDSSSNQYPQHSSNASLHHDPSKKIDQSPQPIKVRQRTNQNKSKKKRRRGRVTKLIRVSSWWDDCSWITHTLTRSNSRDSKIVRTLEIEIKKVYIVTKEKSDERWGRRKKQRRFLTGNREQTPVTQ